MDHEKTLREFLDELTQNIPDEDLLLCHLQAKVAAAVLNARTKMGMTQTQLAESIGIGQRQISDMENAGANLTLRTLAKIATALSLDLSLSLEPHATAPNVPAISGNVISFSTLKNDSKFRVANTGLTSPNFSRSELMEM